MSENDKNDGGQTSDEDATFDAIEAETDGAESQPPEDEPVTSKRTLATTSVAWGSLFLALISVAGLGYVILDDRSENQVLNDARIAVDNLRTDIAEANDTIATLRSEVERAQSAAGSADDDLADLSRQLRQLEQQVDERSDLLDSVPPRMSSLERTVAALQGVSVEARNTYLVAEAEYYMQIANAQLQLAGNPYLASLALQQADDRLLQLADPALTDTRRALADEIAALDAMEKPDLAGATLTLGSLARVVDVLPIRTVGVEPTASEATDESAEESGVVRAWDSVKGAFGGLISVTPPADERAPLLTPEAGPLIRSNLSLMLQAARLALLRGEQTAFEQSLDDADAWLDAYFDARSTQVQAARETIAEIQGDYAAGSVPDISNSLRLLRQYKTLAESAR